jgi:F-type H+-transporting ATPase subunit epsilon
VATLQLQVVSQEEELFSGEVDIVLAPGEEGQLGILPNHAPLIAQLAIGELVTRAGEEEYAFAVHGGFIHVLPDQVIVLADVAERVEEIDVERAERARQRALETLEKSPPPEERRLTETALRRSRVRLKLAGERRRRRRRRPEITQSQ